MRCRGSGAYPRASSTDPTGIHMIGLTANMPAPSLGAQSGPDGAVSGTAFTSATGRFTSANTGNTIQITDTGATPPVQYQFTVTFVSATALTLSGSWAGTGTSSLPWVLSRAGAVERGASLLRH